MIISPAYAQSADAFGPIGQLLPFILIFVVFYFLLIRPQQKRAKEHRALVAGLKKNDKVVTSGGIAGKVVKAVEGNDMVDVEIASGVVVSVVRHMITEVKDKSGAPAKADTSSKGAEKKTKEKTKEADESKGAKAKKAKKSKK